MSESVTAIGLMSGTSMDGIDAALVATDGHTIFERGASVILPYDPEFRQRLARAVQLGEQVDRGEEAALSDKLAELHAQAVAKLNPPPDAKLIGFHGHTLWHRPEHGKTLQIGNGALLAALTGIDVVNDLRSADMAAGGQGAPLAPLFHAALATGLERPIVVLNLGGVGNVTYLDENQILAFDTGPANAPIDDWVKTHADVPFDRGGQLAAQGAVDKALIDQWLGHPYFDETPPKSLDRNAFPLNGLEQLDLHDGAATLTAFASASVAAALALLPKQPNRWLVTGGGRHNPTLMGMLTRHLGALVEPVEKVGWDGDALEAQAFAFLAVRSRLGLPLTVPGTTGVSHPTMGGVFHPAAPHATRS